MGPGGHRGLRRELAFDGGSAATSGYRPHHLTKRCGKRSLPVVGTCHAYGRCSAFSDRTGRIGKDGKGSN